VSGMTNASGQIRGLGVISGRFCPPAGGSE